MIVTVVLVFFAFSGLHIWCQVADCSSVEKTQKDKPIKLEAGSITPITTPARTNPNARSLKGVFKRGAYISVQVNVDAFGQNITGDAANEPSIAVNPLNHDQIVIGWRQFDSVSSNFRQAGWAYTQDGGLTWTFPGTLTPGVFRSDPVLDFDSSGNFYYYSLKSDFTCDMFISSNGGINWQGPYPAWGGDKNWMAVDRTGGIGDGNIYCTWTGSSNFTRSTNGGLNYMNPIPSVAYWSTLSVGPDGSVYVTGWGGGSDFEIQRSTNAQNPSVTPSWGATMHADLGGAMQYFGGPNPDGLLGQIWIATNHASGSQYGEVYLLCSVDPPGSDPLDVHFCRSSDNGLTWSSPVKVNDDPVGTNAYQWFGTMSVAPNGRIDVVWNDTRNSGQTNICELYYSYSYDSGRNWSENVAVTPSWNSHIGWPQQNKIGDYYDMVSFDDGAHLAFATTLNGEQDVYYVKLFPDPSLSSDANELSVTNGGTINFSLNAGPVNMNRNYLLLGSLSGSFPGLPLPGGLTTLPINWDLFTDFIVARLNTPLFTDFIASLNSSGQGSAQINAPSVNHNKVGKTMTFAYCLEGNPDWDFVSNPVAIRFVP